eukprot:3941892-Rhodomonas_salina.4
MYRVAAYAVCGYCTSRGSIGDESTAVRCVAAYAVVVTHVPRSSIRWCSTARRVSTLHHIGPYARSVPHIAVAYSGTAFHSTTAQVSTAQCIAVCDMSVPHESACCYLWLVAPYARSVPHNG